MSVYAVRMQTTLLASVCFNVFFYRTANPGALEGTAADLNGVFNTGPVASIKPRLNTGVAFTDLYTFDLFFPTNINTQVIGGAGTKVGESFAPYVCAALRTQKASRIIKRGYKRFAGIIEADVASGVFTAPELTAWQTTGASLAATLVGALANYIPVVVKRVKYTTSGGKIAYRLPELLSEYQAFDVSSWSPNQRPTSQNSRKLPFL